MLKTPTKGTRKQEHTRNISPRQTFRTPNVPKSRHNQDDTPSLKKKRLTDDEFSDMILFDRPEETNLEVLINSMYQLSLNTIKTDTVIRIIHEFKELVPLKRYKYASIIDLLTLSSKCPLDIKFLILSIAAEMVREGNPPTISNLDLFLQETEELLHKGFFEELGKHKTQKELKKELQEMWNTFQYSRRFPIKATPGDLPTNMIEKHIPQEREKKHQYQNQDQDESQKEHNEHHDHIIHRIYTPNLTIDNLFYHETQANETNIERKLELIPSTKRKEIEEIIGLFDEWEKAYDATIKIYELMKKDKTFDLELILSIIPNNIGDFLVFGLQTFEKEGI